MGKLDEGYWQSEALFFAKHGDIDKLLKLGESRDLSLIYRELRCWLLEYGFILEWEKIKNFLDYRSKVFLRDVL